MGSALRSFLRFLFLRGEIGVDLALAVPTVRQWRLSSVPRFIPAQDVERLLRACDLSSITGRRDHAILLLLARLGLRASEVSALELGDLRWREGRSLSAARAWSATAFLCLPTLARPSPLYKEGPAIGQVSVRLSVQEGSASRLRPSFHRLDNRGTCARASRARALDARRALAPSQPGYRHGAAGSFARGDRAGTSPPLSQHDRHLREARLWRSARRRAALAHESRCEVSALHDALEAYLALRRGLGSELREPGALLHRFVEFLDGERATVVTTELALRWAKAPANATPATWAQRLADVRRFATWLSATDPRTEIPPPGLLPDRYRRRPPYIYSDKEVERIVREAARLTSSSGMRAHTYATLFGLLAATGLRLGEALALDRDDVDLYALHGPAFST